MKTGLGTQKMFKELCRNQWHGYPTLDELDACVKSHQGEDKSFGWEGRALWKAMKDYQYDKRKVADDYTRMVSQQVNALDAMKATAVANDVVDAMNQIPDLPATAQPAVELEWVGGHPAMLKSDMLKDKTAQVYVTKDDILHAPNGLPPSRRAVARLTNWINRPSKFHEMLLQEDKKASHVGDTDGSAEEAERDVSLAEIRALLKGLVAK